MKKILALAALFFTVSAGAITTLPYSFSSGQSINASYVNADLTALLDAINNHVVASNPHNSTLAQILGSGNSCGSSNINFNSTQALGFRVENISADPTCNAGNLGRLEWNTTDSLLKVCNGTSYVSIAGSGVNTLQSVLSAGNSAGSSNIDLAGNQILNAKVENRTGDPSASNGRIYYRTDTSELKVCNGSSCTALGGAQGLASVLSTSNSVGATDIDFNSHQAVNMKMENLASNPGTSYTGRLYYNTTSNIPKFYNGSSWLEVGNTNTLAQVMALGNSAGSTNLDLNENQALNFRVENLGSSPGTGNKGRMWLDTSSDTLTYAETATNRSVVATDKTQTLTNKSISGSANTLTNIPDAALSANVGLLNGNQTITGTKTFSASPVVSSLKTPSGAAHILTDGLSSDTIVLANAAQTLTGKSLGATAMTGNLDFQENIANNFRVENRGADPSPGYAGRMYYKTTTGELIYDTGSSLRVLTASNGAVTTPWTLTGNAGTTAGTNFLGTTDSVDLVFKTNSTEALRIKADQTIKTLLGTGLVHSGATGILSSSTLVDADVSSSAAIARSKVAAGSAYAAVVNDSAGLLSSVGPLTDGQLLIGATGALPVAASLTGTANQLTVTPAAGAITLSLPQNIHAAATPTFAGLTLSGFGAGIAHSSAGGLLSSSLLVNADVSGSAAIAYSKLNLGSSIVNADVAAAAAISFSKLATLPSANILLGSAGNVATATAVTGDVTISNAGITAIGTNKVTNAMAAQMAAHTFKGNNTAGTANALDLTATQLTAELNNVVGDSGSGGTKGLVPAAASGDAAANKYLKADGTWATVAASVKVATIQDQKTAGTYGGTFTAGAWRTRDLNTLNDPSGIVTSLSANQFVLPAGTYFIEAAAPGRTVSKHRAKLRNITDSSDTVMGQTSAAPVGTTVMTSSIVRGVFTIAGSKTFEIQHYCSSTEGTDGFGDVNPDGGTEVYTSVSLIKL